MESKELIKQLMPDNWIFNGEEYTQFKSYHEGRIYHTYGWISIDADLDMRIPITPEILEMAGFEKPKYGWGRWTLSLGLGDGSYLVGNTEGTEVWADKPNVEQENSWHDFNIGRDVNKVHDMQNLYFALTGTHLKIELK